MDNTANTLREALEARFDALHAMITEAHASWERQFGERWRGDDDVPDLDYFVALWLAERGVARLAPPAPAVVREAVLAKLREWLGTDGSLYRQVAALLSAPPAEAREPVGVTDAMVEAACAARYPTLWPMPPSSAALVREEMRRTLEAAWKAQPRDTVERSETTPRDSGDALDRDELAKLLVASVIDMDAVRCETVMRSLHDNGVEMGDWRVLIERVDAMQPPTGEPT